MHSVISLGQVTDQRSVLLILTNSIAVKWHAELFSSLGYALALTHTEAIIWRYKQNTTSPGSSKPLVIKLPHPSNNTSQPLPLGLILHDSGSGELALLVIMPVSGRVTYWDNVSSAANVDLARQKQPTFQNTVNGMLSGEVVTKLIGAELDGFILTLSTGRILHLRVKDPQGRPMISTDYLRSNNASNGGLFGGLKNVFSNFGWRRDIAAVKVEASHGKSHFPCIVASTKGLFQVWDVIRNSASSLAFEIDARDEMRRSIGKVCPEVTYLDDDTFSVVDFAIFPFAGLKGNLASHRLLVLTAHVGSSSAQYTLLDLTIQDGVVDVDVVHPITCYSELQYPGDPRKPQVLLPDPAHTAFLVFARSITLVSLSKIEESPSSQLQIESHTLPDPFQDTLYFRMDSEYFVAGCCTETQDRGSKVAPCTFLIHGFGLVHVASLPAKEGQSPSGRTAVTAKTKMEQAIFFGNMPHNLFDFSGRTEISFKNEEIEAAALEINDSIMRSTSDYIPAITPSMEQQLKSRSKALADLAKYLHKFHINLTKATRWQLLWSAEKMAAARAIWQTHSTHLGTVDENEKSLLAELFDMMNEQFKSENQPVRGETDVVRHYLINDIWRIELVVPWAEQAVEELYKEGVQDPVRQAKLISQADDIQICAMEAAFAFRTANANLYGIKDDIEDGILPKGYEDLPEIWTSIPETVQKVKALADLSREAAINSDETELDEQTLIKLARDNPRLVHICCQVYEERCRWLKSRPEARQIAEGEALSRQYLSVRKELIVSISDLELPDEGVKLAEKYRDMQALVDIHIKDLKNSFERLGQPGISISDAEDMGDRIDLIQERMAAYFTTFGTPWAKAFFSELIARGQLSQLFDSTQDLRAPLTKFLRSKPEYAKLSWIQEIIGERNYELAANALMKVQKQESSVWSKNIELSMGKLAILAAEEKGQVQKDARKTMHQKADRLMAMVKIQEALDAYIRPALKTALDMTAETEIAMGRFYCHFVEGKTTLRNTMQHDLKKLISREVLSADDMIDMLTLIDVNVNQDSPDDDDGFSDKRFYLALTLLRLCEFTKTDPERNELHEIIIWRRCLIQDDWGEINKTELQGDVEVAHKTAKTALFQTLRAGYKDGKDYTVPDTCLDMDVN